MRIQRVVARAFGPLQDRTLDLAPGMTVVAGPNESGKSSWHAAVRLAVTGVRRGKGPGTAAERQLVERHRPWDQPGRWEVEARLQLDDGRQIDITQDLGSKVACRAVDVALGRDVSDEILDGTPDASRWLGLDREAFAATLVVNQAQIVAVADAADALQEHMQRAAATRGTDATAAQAIARLEQFRRDAVGADTVAAKGPLRTAKNRVSQADGTLAVARQQHAEYLEQSAAVDRAERAAATAGVQVTGAEAAIARMQAAELTARAGRAAQLTARYPAPPPSLAADDDLAARASAAREAWLNRPRPVTLGGPSAAEIERDLGALPSMPEGDVEPHPTVLDAQRAALRADQAVELAGPEPALPASDLPALDAARLRALARKLEDRALPEAAALEAELDQLRRRGAGPGRMVAVAVAVVGVASGAMLALTGLGAAGAIVAAAALLVAAGIGFTSWGGGAGAAVRRAEKGLVPYREAAERVRQEQALAVDEVRRAGLPENPAALEALAAEVVRAEQLGVAHAAWLERRTTLEATRLEARRALRSALAARGQHDPVADELAAAEAYLAACRANAEQQRAAEHGDVLRAQLAARRAAEEAAATAAQREAAALGALQAVAREMGIADHEPEAICAAIDRWRAERATALSAAQQALGEWQQLQGLLDGASLEDLQAEAARRRQRANELAQGLPPEAVTLPMGSDPEEYLTSLRRQSQALDQEHDVARGALDARRSALPDVAEAEEAAATARAELERVERLAATIDAALALLRAAQERVHRDLAPVLAQGVNRWLPAVSGDAYTEASVDPGDLRVSVKEAATGRWRDARLLSEGAREQVYLLLRVAMAEHLVTTAERAPLLLDEVTAQADGERKRQLLEMLHRLSTERQVILFTHDDAVMAWADEALRAPQDAIVRLEPLRQLAAVAVAVETGPLAEPASSTSPLALR